jgi:COP9 signalosome complex subunit 3
MSAKLQQSQINDWDDLFNRLTIFIMECNGEQIRYAAQSFAELCHLFADQLIKRNTPLVGLSPLLKAICKLQMSGTCLTSVHSDVARLALASKCFTRPVLSILDVNYNEIAREATANPKYILQFFYYAGMITAAMKKYSRALYFLEACVTIPSIAVSHIMLEAYKKYLLIWLIVHGDLNKEALVFPKYTSPVVNKYIRPLCAPYHEVVKAFYSTQHSELNNTIEKYSNIFNEDGNAGLVSQVVVARQKTSIKRLTKTFLTLSLGDVAARVGLASPHEAEKQLVTMIEEGSIYARISQKDGNYSK